MFSWVFLLPRELLWFSGSLDLLLLLLDLLPISEHELRFVLYMSYFSSSRLS